MSSRQQSFKWWVGIFVSFQQLQILTTISLPRWVLQCFLNAISDGFVGRLSIFYNWIEKPQAQNFKLFCLLLDKQQSRPCHRLRCSEECEREARKGGENVKNGNQVTILLESAHNISPNWKTFLLFIASSCYDLYFIFTPKLVYNE